MAEEVSPESKLYVKEEIERSRKEFKEALEKAQSRATKTFATVAMVVGLVTGLSAYFSITGAIKAKVDEAGITTLVKSAQDANDIIQRIRTNAEDKLSDLKTELKKNQFADKNGNGYAWIGDIKLVWGTGKSTGQNQLFEFKPASDKQCFTVITDLTGRCTSKTREGFVFSRHKDYQDYAPKVDFTFIAIGN